MTKTFEILAEFLSRMKHMILTELFKISSEMLQISLTYIVEILTKAADLEVQPADLIFNGVKPQRHRKI